MQSYSEAYKAAGVDITAGYQSVEAFKGFVRATQNERVPGKVLGGIGSFGGFFAPDFNGIAEPVFVSGTDGVGTKLRIAQILNKHDTVGIDLVAMCVNDILCSGAKPLFFLDYIACGKVDVGRIVDIVKGVSEGCIQSNCALVGGETAEHPGTMDADDYDLAGFAVGVVDRSKILDGSAVKAGDLLIGLASSGVHSNGFSLIRKIFDVENCNDTDLLNELLTPTKIYVNDLSELHKRLTINGIAHITGGGLIENIPRMFPEGLSAKLDTDHWTMPDIFGQIAIRGNVSKHDMFNTYNMGVGMVLAVPESEAETARSLGLRIIGRVESGRGLEI
ncbi:MAG: phosphoribosylformylglycinamidine cyclo-ligase [Oscillospiraceae bacterium]|jgi:phosphoribosylformylglycinamidine cyclo-ligase|nr:phosphoribosylformylglycinamidine cyclo-ligase [Oscillospiraceae bacterium]